MLKQYIKNDLKSNRVASFIITCSIAIAVMLSVLTGILTIQLFGSMNQFMETAQTPHLLQMHAGEINQQAIEEFAAENKSIADYQIMEFVNLDGAKWQLGDTTLTHSVQDNGVSIQSTSFDYLLNQQNEIIQPREGELYAPITYRQEGLVDIGTPATVAGIPLTIKGFLRDSQMNSTLASSKRFLLHEKDFQKILAEGQVEYLIEFKLHHLKDLASVQNDYQRAELPNNGPMITYPLFRTINALTEGITIVLILLISFTVVLISFLLIRLTILTQLEDDFNQIGILKAIGFRNGDIRKLYAQKYIWMIIGAGIIGLILAIIISPRFQENIQTFMGEYDGRIMMYSGGILAGLAIMGIIIAYVYWTLRKIKGVSAADATKAGFRTNKKSRSSPISIAKNSKMPTNLNLAFNQISLRVNLFITLALVIIFSLFILIVPFNLNQTISSPTFVKYMGVGESDLIFNIQQVENVKQLSDKIENDLQADPAIELYAATYLSNFQLSDGNFINVTLGDHHLFPLEYIEGTGPTTEDEIALSQMNADELEKAVGDTLMIIIDGTARELSVQGVYSDVTNGGKTSKAIFKPQQVETMSAMIYADLAADINQAEVVDSYLNRYPQIKIAETAEFLNQTYSSTTESIRVISLGGAIISFLIVSLITILTLRLILARSRQEIKTMSVLGFRLKDIKEQLLWQLSIISIIGISVGLVFANTLGESLAGLLLSTLGGSGFHFIVQPLLSYVALPLFFLATILTVNYLALNRFFKKGVE